MLSGKKINLQKVLASLYIVCTQCHVRVEPSQILRVRWLAETHFLASNMPCCFGGTNLFRPCQTFRASIDSTTKIELPMK